MDPGSPPTDAPEPHGLPTTGARDAFVEPVFSAATAEALELPQLLALVAHLTATDLGRDLVLGLAPAASPEALAARHAEHGEAERLVSAQPLVPALEEPLAPLLAELAAGGHDLGGRELLHLADLLAASAEARERIQAADPPCPALAVHAAPLPGLDELRQILRRTFDRRGEIRENATPRLAELRGRIRSSRDRVYDELRSRVEEYRDHLSEDTIPLRGGRLVLVLQSGAKGRAPGLVHGRSASGKSFYFEPLSVVELNNDLQQASDEEEAEKRRILADLVRRLRAALPAIEAHARFVAGLDRLQAAVRFAERCAGRLAEPAGRGELRLVGARHPLLDPRLGELRRDALGNAGHVGAIVPLDLELDPHRRALVVTGPNAGGKTVTLKATGLLALAHLCGLPLPVAKGTRLPWLRAVVATVGDEQDLFADRSTFSGRLLRLREAWEAASEDALVLLDELGSGTDPEEGSALGVALLEGLLARRCLTLITTHLSQLAAAALEADGAYCATMEFDPASGAPTYRLLPGPPGGSEAMALARRLGLPAAWLDRAEQLLGTEHRELRRLLGEVERSRRELAETGERLAAELADATALRERLVRREAELVAERKSVGEAMQRRLATFRDEVQRELRQEAQRIERRLAESAEGARGVARGGARGKGQAAAGEAMQRLFAAAPEFVAPPEAPRRPEVGEEVRHRRLGWVGKLEEEDRGRAQVRVQGKVLRCATDDLLPTAASPPPGANAGAAAPPRAGRGSVTLPETEAADVAAEIHLIGQRVEPALHALDEYLDRALLASRGELRVVHGHGSGRLRQAVREHLRGHHAVAAQRPGRPEEGGDGATVVTLRG